MSRFFCLLLYTGRALTWADPSSIEPYKSFLRFMLSEANTEWEPVRDPHPYKEEE
jgi:hypothetical protein